MKKTIFYLFCILLLSSIAIAVPPTFTEFTSTTSGLQIEVPAHQYMIKDGSVKTNIHVFNISNGWLMTNNTTDCELHIYNQSGNHLASEVMTFSTLDRDFYTTLDGNNFSYLGFRSFIIWCNTSNEGGFTSGTVEITIDGKEKRDVLPITIVLMGAAILFIAFGIIVLLFRKVKK